MMTRTVAQCVVAVITLVILALWGAFLGTLESLTTGWLVFYIVFGSISIGAMGGFTIRLLNGKPRPKGRD